MDFESSRTGDDDNISVAEPEIGPYEIVWFLWRKFRLDHLTEIQSVPAGPREEIGN